MRVSQERNRPDAEHCPSENDPNSANGLSRTGCRFNQRADKCCQGVDVVGRRFLEEADQRKAGPRNRREAKARKVSKVLKKKPPAAAKKVVATVGEKKAIEVKVQKGTAKIRVVTLPRV
ncbi:ribosome biogenesis regulatory protein [Culex quinquefasciatus]|uniref:Ribosome biogenesis regulatory protein n=1 Tax=Culex quinquefasciatus TaxID=7176 RepID=B0WPT3_CULQU|nr:ribosome biogenesis regulatory protein [Culex quinquefasciatus]|eukprot:XP_001850717.1 ribosome biogenesis regulatory protein [Culex quinquefasciatus]